MTAAEAASFLGDADGDGAPDGDLDGDGAVTPGEAAAVAPAPASGGANAGTALPDTGGPAPLVAGLGALLVAAGGLLRRLVRG